MSRQTAALRADLIGSGTASGMGMTVGAHAPVLALCRKLLEAGYDPELALDVYRGAVLCLRVRSIGEAARLTVQYAPNGRPRFRPHVWGASPPMRQKEGAATPQHMEIK